MPNYKRAQFGSTYFFNDTNYSMRWGWIKKEFTKPARYVVEKTVGTAHPTKLSKHLKQRYSNQAL